MRKNEIILGDCLEVMRGMPDNCVDVVLTDPPYFKIVANEWDRQWKTIAEFQEWVGVIGRELRRIMRPAASLYWFCDDKNAAYCQVELDKIFHLLNSLVWKKPSTLAVKGIEHLRSYATLTERCLFYEMAAAPGVAATGLEAIHSDPDCFASIKNYMRAERAKMMEARGWTKTKEFDEWVCRVTNTASKVARHCWADSQFAIPTAEQWAGLQTGGFFRRGYGDVRLDYEDLRREYEDLRREYEDLRREYEDLRRVWNAHEAAVEVLEYGLAPQPYIHPTQKPLPLVCYLLERSTKPGMLVFDPFAGSGTTAVACHSLGLDFVCVEKDPDYHAASVARLRKCQEQARLPLAFSAAPVQGELFT